MQLVQDPGDPRGSGHSFLIDGLLPAVLAARLTAKTIPERNSVVKNGVAWATIVTKGGSAGQTPLATNGGGGSVG